MPKAKKKITVKKEAPKFSLVLEIGGEKYTGSGDTVITALEEIAPKKIMTWGTFYIKSGEKKVEIKMRPIPIRRIFVGQQMAKVIFEKRVLMNLK